MKKKVLALAGCIAATAPTTSIADVLTDNLFGLNLGEVHSSSFLNQPFKGVIPFLFTSVENAKNLNVKLAPESIFNKVGAEKHPILSNLIFQIRLQDNKPVILISSDLPIRLPFLNFILEIQSPDGSVYQDYTVLLDPESKQVTNPVAEYISMNSGLDTNEETDIGLSSEESLKANGTLLLASLSSTTLSSATLSSSRQNPKYRVKSGDSLSRIARNQLVDNASLSTMSRLIYQKNPKAFIRGDMNKIKKGAILNLPTVSEINGFELARNSTNSNSITNKSDKVKQQSNVVTKIQSKVALTKSPSKETYKVIKGDSLSKISQKFTSEGMSLTKVMNAIHSNNPDAFVNNSKNKIKAGAELSIPLIAQANISLESNKKTEIIADEQKTLHQSVPEQSLDADQYLIQEGDSLSSITKKIGYESVPFPEMLKAIYKQNPDAFIDGSMTRLSIGTVITLPQLDSIEVVDQVDESKSTEQVTLSQVSSSNVSTDKNAESLNLVKRIRELRKELKQSKDNLSEMKERLSDKEILLQEKSIQLEALNTAITETKNSSAPVLMPVSAIKRPMENQVVTKNQETIQDSYKPISKAEMAKFKRDLLSKKRNTLKQITETKEIEQTIDASSTYKASLEEVESNFVSPSINEFVSNNYAYMTLSLLLGLLLIRYRRELYSYTYSTINYDQPTYYPIPDSDKLQLKEKNISYHDPKMDEESYVDDQLMPNITNQVTTSEEIIVIDPRLVEAKEDLVENNFKEKEEAQQIEHCEHLVTELFDDLETEENIASSSEWTNIEKVCDNYIDKIKDTDSGLKASDDDPLLDGVTDFNHMMTDLLESLDKVDKSVKKYNISDKDFPEIVKRPEEVVDGQRLI